MSIQKLIKEALAKSPLGVKAALEEELRVRVAEAVSGKMEDAALEEAVNEKQIKKDLDAGMSHDAVIGKHANKKLTNTDEIRKVIQQHAWNKRMKKEDVEQIGESKAPKIACVKCDEVATSKAWEKNHGTCPHCKTSTQGVQESVEQIDELSKKTLVSYIKKASDNKGMHDRTIGRTFDKASREKSVNRAIGIRNAADRLAKEDVDLSEAVGMKDGYYVTNQRTSEITHDKPFADSKSAISHANKGENKTGYVHRVHKVKGGKIDKQWEYNGGHMDGGWEHFSDFKGDDARSHMRNIPKHFLHGND